MPRKFVTFARRQTASASKSSGIFHREIGRVKSGREQTYRPGTGAQSAQYKQSEGGSRAKFLEERLARQGWACPLCRAGFRVGQAVAVHHPTGHKLDMENSVVMHWECHTALHALGGVWRALTGRKVVDTSSDAYWHRIHDLHCRRLPSMIKRFRRRRRYRNYRSREREGRAYVRDVRSRLCNYVRNYRARRANRSGFTP